jgi:hypothetical protein
VTERLIEHIVEDIGLGANQDPVETGPTKEERLADQWFRDTSG